MPLPRDIGVVIVAGGRGARVGGEVPKQYREIGGIPMLLRAIHPFASHPEVAHVVVVLPPEDVADPPDWLAAIREDGLTVVAGGAERSDSVSAGLEVLIPECGSVLVHDAARPFVDRDTIDAVIASVRNGVGAVPAVALGDTLKEAQAGARVIARTIPRDRLWRAQTPQGFPRDLLERAHREGRAAGVHGTDDAALVERLGVEVRLVPGSERNIKVTTAEDLKLAEALSRSERT